MLIFLLACVADPPSATSISPTTGAAGTEVTVSGANFVDGMTVQLGKQPLAKKLKAVISEIAFLQSHSLGTLK